MPKGRMKSLHGIVRKHGVDAFLDAAGYYTCHVKDTAVDTIYEMEHRWYDRLIYTEAEKMLDDYNHGLTILN
jgi:hypothetical protein